jgi:tetratricopeptide repeat protein
VRLAAETVDNVKALHSAAENADQIPETLRVAIESAREEIDEARELLESLTRGVQTSIERQSLCGSAWKRTALIERIARQSEKEIAAIQRMHECYLHAEGLARESKDANLFYPAMNRMAAEIILNAGKNGWVGLHPDALTEVRENLVAKTKDDPDFWSSAGLVELDFYEALARRAAADRSGKLAAEFPKLKQGYEDLYARVNSMGMWSSVYDQARFVLEKYAENVPAQEEKDAANKLLVLLKEMATGTRH